MLLKFNLLFLLSLIVSVTPKSEYLMGNSVSKGTSTLKQLDYQEDCSSSWAKKDTIGDQPTYTAGDFAQGGIVFWVDETGQHGLVIQNKHLGSHRWYAGSNGLTNANDYWDGAKNTQKIIEAFSTLGDDGRIYAALACNDFVNTVEGVTYDDWYLPSRGELELIWETKDIITRTAMANGGTRFPAGSIWSSTEIDAKKAWSIEFHRGNWQKANKSNMKFFPYIWLARAVRSF